VGVARQRGRTADDRMIKAELHPPHWARRRMTVRPSTLLVMTLGFEELAATTTSVHTCDEASISVNAVASATTLVTRLGTTKNDSASIQITILEIIITIVHHLPTDGVLACVSK